MLNPYPACIATQDKIVASRRLRAAGIPTPRSWITSDWMLLHALAEARPLIVKPYRGHRGAGIYKVHRPGDLATIPSSDTPMLVQEFISGTGQDLKVYVVGSEVFAVRKPFSAMSFTVPGKPVAVSDELRAIALRCGEAFGLGLYGLDAIESADGPVVVDLNYFPGYKGVPNVAVLIADYIERYARGQHRLDLPPLDLLEHTTPSFSEPRETLPNTPLQPATETVVDAA